jgi:hypothetical protein
MGQSDRHEMIRKAQTVAGESGPVKSNQAIVWRRGHGLILAFVVALAAILSPRCEAAPQDEFPEYQLKAAFLFNFAKFITWPSNAFASDEAPLTIGILGDDPFKEHLSKVIADKTVGGRKLAIKHFGADDAIEGCCLLFISRSERERVPNILASLKGKSILTVSDFDKFAHRGGMINLVVVSNSIRFEINPEVAEKAGLKISSKLGSYAIVVKTEESK